MKKIIFLLYLFTLTVFSQNPSVEKSVFEIQSGLFGIWGTNESKLSNKFTLRSELGIEAGLFENSDKFFWIPSLSIEPRFYHNLNRRISKSKRINGNIGNFIAIGTTYNPDWIIINAQKNSFITDIKFFAKYGLKRVIFKKINYEMGLGLLYIKYIDKEPFVLPDDYFGPEVHLRIGYQF